MKSKKILSLLTAAAMLSGMWGGVNPVFAAEPAELSYGTDYTCAAYFNNAKFYTGDTAKALTIGTTSFSRSEGGTTTADGQGSGGYYVAYAVMDISNIDITSVTVDAASDDNKDSPYKLFYTTTNEDVATKAPGAVAQSGDTDFAGSTPNYNTFKNRYALTEYTSETAAVDVKDSNYLVIAFTGWKATTFKSLTITGTSSAAAEPVAMIGGTSYTSMDAAMAAAKDQESTTITLLKDVSYSGTGYYAKTANTTTIASDTAGRHTLTLTANAAEIFTWNGIVFDNVEVTMPANDKITGNVYAYQQNGSNNALTLQNGSLLTGINTSDCFSCAYSNNVINSTVTGNSVSKALFSNRNDSTVENSTITGNTAEGIGVIEVTNSSTTTVKNSTINNNSVGSCGDINVKKASTLVLSGNTVIGSVYIESNEAIIKLASDFTGSAVIKNSALTEGTVVATVDSGARTSGITVEGLDTSVYELQNIEGSLTIKTKTAPSANIVAANFASSDSAYTASGNTLSYGNDIVYGYKATVTGDSETTYKTVGASVKTTGGKTDSKEMSINISGGATVYIISSAELNMSESTVYFK